MKTQLGHYALVSELGRGGMGVVYKGFETSLNRYVAIKVLADSLAHDASVKERFLREARSMASLNDPHIIQIYFIGDDEGQTFFVMEFVDGESLGSVLKRERKLKPEQAAKVIYQTALGLSTAHDRGVIHRDIKPGNLMLTARGSVKIADFGIALTTQDFSKKLTSTGEFVGTPGYLSPEVCLGKPVDQRSDIFSLGIVLFECLAGRMPFTDESPLGLMLEVVKAEIPDVCTLNSEVDAELSRVLTRMIAKDPAERYQSCHELVADLGQHPLVARGGPITLQTKMTTAAATMIGQKTPVSGQQALPSTTPTPRPMPAMGSVTPPPASATTAARAAPDLGAPVHQSVLDRGAAPKRSALPLAIAAIAFLLLVSAAWAFRDRIPAQLAQWFPSQIAAPPAAPAPATTTTVAATPTPPAPPAPPAAPPPPPDVANGAVAAATPPNASLNDILGASAPANGAAATAQSASTNATANSGAAAAPANDSAPAPRASQVEPLRDLAAAQAAQAPPPKQRVAAVTPPPPVSAPPRPHIPTIAVIAGGDEAVAEPAQHSIEQALSRNGFHLVDEASMPRVEHLLQGARANTAEILNVIAHRGDIDAVIIIHARGVGSQQVTFYGQSDNLMTAQLNINAYAVEGRRKLGAGWSDNVNFTAMSAKDKAEEAVEPLISQIEERLSEYRAGRHKG
ncbi:MAG TPA: serine/threonine-protein kinase [Rhodanobacteraceae bacterium]|nr:serine/threonine-protein kinase [Rhodanobacteraceae bacterium]